MHYLGTDLVPAQFSPSCTISRHLILSINGPIWLGHKCKVWYYLGRNPAILSHDMKARKLPPDQDDLLRARLVEMIDMRGMS